MSGGGGSSKPPAPAPPPTPAPVEDMTEAKSSLRERMRRKRGHASTILAGRLNSEHGKILLGE